MSYYFSLFLYLTRSNIEFMNLLQEVVLSLSKEESRFFKLFAGRTNTKDERKDLLLFDFIKKFLSQKTKVKCYEVKNLSLKSLVYV